MTIQGKKNSFYQSEIWNTWLNLELKSEVQEAEVWLHPSRLTTDKQYKRND